jgi:uncharacterized protein
MNDQVLEKMISDYLALQFNNSSFAWQGGEPTIMGIDFFQRAIKLQQKHQQNGQHISNALQTNATLLNEKWCRFLSENNFLVGISIDGPKKYHDHYRLDKAGKGTFDRVMQAIKLCKEHNVEFNILTLLNDQNVNAPGELFDFFISNNIKYLQFVPCVEKDPATNQIADFSITPEQYGNFICDFFDRWIKHGPEKISIRIFDAILNRLVYDVSVQCSFARKCDDYIVIEHNGDAFCCDFFVQEDCKLGNIMQQNITDLFQSNVKKQFAKAKSKVANKCFVCRYKYLCNGGCLKDRLATGGDFKALSYFCTAYKQIFDHCLPKLNHLAAEYTSNMPK